MSKEGISIWSIFMCKPKICQI